VLFFQPVAIVLLLAVCAFAPGYFFVRRLRWSPMEKLCGGVALSLVLLWLAAWSLYVTGAPAAASYAVSAVCLGLGAACFQDLRRLVSIPRVRHALLGFAFLLGWTLLALCIIRVYSGATWKADWLEHFQRTLFFAERFPTDTPILGGYLLPARPPAENVLAGLFLNQTAHRFELFQITFAFLNLLAFLPCCLALPMLTRSRRFGIVPLVALFAASPVVLENSTYTWTKMLTAFFVILAILMYRRRRFTFAFVCLAMGLLVHYSAGPYIVFFALHYLIAVRPFRWQRLARIAVTSGGLLATWFAWSAAVYGVKNTAASNTSVTSSQSYQGSTMGKIAGNVADSLVPHLLRDPKLAQFFDQPNDLGYLRDNLFLSYQGNLIFSMGAIGGPVVLWLLFRRLRRGFWLWMIGTSVVLGLAVVGERDPYGTAHLTLLPLQLLGLTLLAGRFRQSRVLAFLLMAGCVIDFSLGVFLHLRVQHLENTAEQRYFAEPSIRNGRVGVFPLPDGLSGYASENWLEKHEVVNVIRWKRELADVAAEGKAQFLAILDRLTDENQRHFRGWYERHGGEVEYLGDHFGASGIPLALMVVVFGGLMWRLWLCVPLTQAVAVSVKRKKR
jgi:hypothetical protein